MTQEAVLSYRLNPYSTVLRMRAARCVPLYQRPKPSG